MPVQIGKKITALTGPGLVTALNKDTDQIRTDAGIRPKGEIAVNAAGEAAYRYYGKLLPEAAQGVEDVLRVAGPAGVFPGLGFTADDYAAARTRADDTAKAESKVHALAADVSAEAKDARDSLAGMTFQVQRSMEYVQSSPGADPTHKALINANNEHFIKAMTKRSAFIADRRAEGTAQRETLAANSALSEENQTLSTQAAVEAAQKGLQFQEMTGAGLTPRDLVLTPDKVQAPATAQPATPAKTRPRAKAKTGRAKPTAKAKPAKRRAQSR